MHNYITVIVITLLLVTLLFGVYAAIINFYLPEFISIIVIVSLFAALFFGVYKASINHDDKLWNDGHCDVCGGTWVYEQAVGHRSSTSYIYVCDDCGKRIELYEVR